MDQDQSYAPLEDLANNPGLSHLVNQIFSHLNQKELMICRLVSKSFRDRIDNNKQWWITQLFLAIANGGKETINYLLKSSKYFGISIDTNNINNTLHQICFYNRTDVFENVVKCLKEDSCDIDANTPCSLTWTSLHVACRYGTLETLKLLLTLKPNMKALTYCGETIIHLAARNSNSDVLQYLLETNSSMVDQTIDQIGWTALHYACIVGIFKSVKLLLESPDIKSFDEGDIDGNTPLHYASNDGHDKIVKYILSQSEIKSIDINKVNNFGYTAEGLAQHNGHTKVVEIFKMWKRKSEIKNEY